MPIDTLAGFGSLGFTHADVDDLLAGGGKLFVDERLGDGSYSVVVTNNVAPEFPTGRIPEDTGGAESDTDDLLVVRVRVTDDAGNRRAAACIIEITDPAGDGAPTDPGRVNRTASYFACDVRADPPTPAEAGIVAASTTIVATPIANPIHDQSAATTSPIVNAKSSVTSSGPFVSAWVQ